MSIRNVLPLFVLVLIVFSLASCNKSDEYLTVSEVWQNAKALEGKRVRIRGAGGLIYEPIHPAMIGGCSLVPSANSPVKGIAMLFAEPLNDQPRREIFISESSFICEGNTCGVTCKPFKPPADTRTLALDSVSATTYEFVGTLRVDTEEGNDVLTLDEIDLESSRQLVDEKWEPIPTGEFSWIFP